MRRLDVVQLCVVLIGLFAGYQFFESMLQVLYFAVNWISEGSRGVEGMFKAMLQVLLLTSLYLLFSIILIRNSKAIAEWVASKGSIDGDIRTSFNGKQLLYAVFIIIGFLGLLKTVPNFLFHVYDYFKNNRGDHGFDIYSGKIVSGRTVLTEAVTIALYVLLLIYSHIFSEYFANKIHNDEPTDIEPR